MFEFSFFSVFLCLFLIVVHLLFTVAAVNRLKILVSENEVLRIGGQAVGLLSLAQSANQSFISSPMVR